MNPAIFNNINLEKEIQPMKTGDASGWGMKYKWVSLPVTDDNKYSDLITPPNEWCQSQFGNPGVKWFYKKDKFYFKDERDMTMFILRWVS